MKFTAGVDRGTQCKSDRVVVTHKGRLDRVHVVLVVGFGLVFQAEKLGLSGGGVVPICRFGR